MKKDSHWCAGAAHTAFVCCSRRLPYSALRADCRLRRADSCRDIGPDGGDSLRTMANRPIGRR